LAIGYDRFGYLAGKTAVVEILALVRTLTIARGRVIFTTGVKKFGGVRLVRQSLRIGASPVKYWTDRRPIFGHQSGHIA